MTLAPWDYLFSSFSHKNFPDLFHPTWIAAAILLTVLTVLYYTRTKALHRHPPYLEMWEWLWWTGLITFSMIIIESVFVFDFFLLLATVITGLATLVWIRFVRFPPMLNAHQARLARERYYSKQKFADPESTIKRRGGRRQQQRRRR